MSERSDSLSSLLDRLSCYTACTFSDNDVEELLTCKSKHTDVASSRNIGDREVSSHEAVLQYLTGIETPAKQLQFEVSIDGKMIEEDLSTFSNENEWKFAFGIGDIYLLLKLEENEGIRKLMLNAVGGTPSEFAITSQMRVHASFEEESMKVLDRDVFDFGVYSKTIQYELVGDIRSIKLELRLINTYYRRHPTFEEGDVVLKFHDGSTIRTWKSLLSFASPYMALKMKKTNDDDVVDLSPFEKDPFIELLLQLYPTGRPVWAKFKTLALAAVSFDAQKIIAKLSEHIYEYRRVPIYRRLEDAASLHLYPSLAALVEEADRMGAWITMIHNGYDPVKALGEEIYTHVVCPAIVRVKLGLADRPHFRTFDIKSEDILCEKSSSNPYNVCIMLLGTAFYMNKGILQSHGGGNFALDNNGRLIATLSKDVYDMCKNINVPVGKVFLELILSLYPYGPHVSMNLIRPALAFASHLGLRYAVERLEQSFISEPVLNAAQFIEHLQLAQTYRLPNLLRYSAMRAEGNCMHLMKEVIARPEFLVLSQQYRQPILDRTCSGWALGWPMLNDISGTDMVERRLTRTYGGPPEPESDCGTFRSIHSDEVFEDMDGRLTIEG